MQFYINPNTFEGSSLHVIPLLENNLVKTLEDKIKKNIKSSLFSGKKDSTFLLETEDGVILLVGLGEKPEPSAIEKSFRRVLAKNRDLVEKIITLDFHDSFTNLRGICQRSSCKSSPTQNTQ